MNTDFNEALETKLLEFIQEHYGLEVFTPGLLRTKAIYAPFILMAKSHNVKVTIIAGTNGKGQTAHTLAHLLETAQLSTALWTSPHILSIRERFRFGEADISYADLESEIFNTHIFLKKNHSELTISFYEFLFLVFLRLAFNENSLKRLKHLILEVGLGGRLDAVNHFDADCACITSISRDHQSILGARYDLILNEKLGVGRIGRPLFTQFRLQYLNQLTEDYCKKSDVLWNPIPVGEYGKSTYFEDNQKMAHELFAFLGPGKTACKKEAIPTFRGRREEMTFKGNTLIFIGAHNIDGIRRMIELFKTQNSPKLPSKILLSFSKRPTNELDVMLKILGDFFGEESKMVLASFDHPKALDISELEKLGKKFNKINKGLLDFGTDWKTELNNSKNQTVLVCGSYYFIGEVQRFILQSS